ncbi:hypothetical protein MAR_017525 [Mya arenaria]|uniref:Uncharacterized protein n=1 Tax=Mya arenaria TaxID=6604 RepID=A0ABY7EC11_MYAAR|nr:hypothetical protein MAR_017525 [Mya arenaria]
MPLFNGILYYSKEKEGEQGPKEFQTIKNVYTISKALSTKEKMVQMVKADVELEVENSSSTRT